KPIEIVWCKKGSAREIDLLSERSVKFAWMSHALVDLKCKLCRTQNQISLGLRANRSVEKQHSFFTDSLCVQKRIPMLDHLPACQLLLPAETLRVRAFLPIVAVCSIGFNTKSGSYEGLIEPRTF